MPIRLCEVPHEQVVPGLKLLSHRGRNGIVVEKQYSGASADALERDIPRGGPNDPLVFISWEGDSYNLPASWWLSGMTTITVKINEDN